MDDLLKAYAKKRQDEAGAPLEMHPATRRLLQAEVAKLRPQSPQSNAQGKSWFATWLAFGPRLVWAMPVVVVLGLGVWVFRRPAVEPEQAVFFAKNEAPAAPVVMDERRAVALNDESSSLTVAPQPSLQLGLERAGQPASAPAGQMMLAESLGKQVALQKEKAALAFNAPLPTSAPASAANEPVKLTAKDSYADAKVLADKMPGLEFKSSNEPQKPQLVLAVEQGAVALQSRGAATAVKKADTSDRASFTQQAQPAQDGLSAQAATYNYRQDAKAGGSVLLQFDVMQSGDRLQLVDADGSVYEGQVETQTGVATSNAAGSTVNVAAQNNLPLQRANVQQNQNAVGGLVRREADAPMRYYNFRVSGTNRTLRQPVVVEGLALDGATNMLAAPYLPASRRIQGRLRIGATNEQSLDAIRSVK